MYHIVVGQKNLANRFDVFRPSRYISGTPQHTFGNEALTCLQNLDAMKYDLIPKP